LIYLDHAATTPIDPSVRTVMDKINSSHFANPSSIHSSGQKSKVLIENSRKIVARFIDAKAGEIVFTSGGTEANNLALIGAARANIDNGNHIITSKIEHPSVLETCKYLSANGFRISYLNVDENGLLDVAQLKNTICNQTILVSLMMVNNETGCLLPIKEVGQLMKDLPIIFHTDAVQALGKIDFQANALNVDLLSLSSHKIYGPKGCGALFVRQGTTLEPILYGGFQETSRRSGTENLPAIAGFAEAVNQIQFNESNRNKIHSLSSLFENELKNTIPNLIINGEEVPRVPGFSNVYFPFLAGDSILMNLDLHDIAVSTGSACSSGSQKPSHVLRAMGFDDERINNSVRFSFGRHTTEDEILRTVDVLKNIYDNSLKQNKI
jgi:cysteine desulfurase